MGMGHSRHFTTIQMYYTYPYIDIPMGLSTHRVQQEMLTNVEKVQAREGGFYPPSKATVQFTKVVEMSIYPGVWGPWGTGIIFMPSNGLSCL